VRAVLRSLFENLKQAHGDPRVKAIVVAGANNNFSPGFDIQQFQQVCQLDNLVLPSPAVCPFCVRVLMPTKTCLICS
jgi:enoyl-CoA hydratase/carnithine racemase